MKISFLPVTLVALVTSLFVFPILAAGGTDSSIVLVYDGSGREGLASNLTHLWQQACEDCEFVITTDPYSFNSLAFLPQVRLLIFLMNERGTDLSTGVAEWFFGKGGSLLGNLGAGDERLSDGMAKYVFPIFGNATTTGTFNRLTRRYEMQYQKKVDHPIANGVSDFFGTPEGRMLVRWSRRSHIPVRLLPSTGSASDVYVRADNGFPLVVVYEASGRSVFFSSLDPSSDYGSLLNQPDLHRLLENSFGWLLDNKEKSSTYNVSAVARKISDMYEGRASIRESARAARKEAGMRRLGFDLAVTALSAAGCLVVYRLLVMGK